MNTYTMNDIRELKPCYDPTRYLPDDWTGTLLDILAVEDCPAEDRLWVVIGLLDDNQRRLIACQFVRLTPLAGGGTVWDLLTDERSRNAVEVAERFANGEATKDELAAAGHAAWYAAWSAAGYAAGYAAWYAAGYAAWSAAGYAASAAATDAASAAAINAATDAQIKIAREFVSTS